MTKIRKFLGLLTLLFVVSSCGSLTSFSTNPNPLIVNSSTKVFIKMLNCNTEKCLQSATPLHLSVRKSIVSHFEFENIQLVKDKSLADYSLIIISAFEEAIQPNTPRNIYLIIKNNEGTELRQFGMAESFSTPLTTQ
ncbi:MAG: hypothetical protein KC493_09840, partial [Bacteriovoracaceae bacterium]|nr:hypothetical protein [Bacteriovoracaceae bacterium]